MAMDSEILIAGGGIGGLTAALALMRQGLNVRVFEQSPALGEVGAGLTLSTGAMRSLDTLGLTPQLEQKIARTRGFPFLHYRTGRLLAGTLEPEPVSPSPPPLFGEGHMFRADLHTILADAVRAMDPNAILLGRRVASVSQTHSAAEMTLTDGAIVRGSALIGCDGVRSAVRGALWGDGEPTFTGRVAYRFLVPAEQALPYLETGGRAAVFVGPGRTVNRYLISEGRILNCVGLSKTETWSAEGWSHPASTAELLAEFAGWHPDLLALMRLAPNEGLIRWGIFQREPLETWRKGRISLLGDAAHPMLPFLGLGAAMAVEDGIVLGEAFARHTDPNEALRLYEQVRLPRTLRVFQGSMRQGEIFDTIDPDNYPPSDAPSHDPSFYTFDPQGAFD